MPVDYIGFAYAATVAAGGIIGYAKAASIPSLSAGLVFGSLLGYGAYQTTKNPNNLALSLGTSAVLGGIMGFRFLNTGKVMPAGILAALSNGYQTWCKTSYCMVCKKRVDNPGENAEVLQTSHQNNIQEQNIVPKELLTGNNDNVL